MGLLNSIKNVWNGIKTSAGKMWNGATELAGGMATGMMLYHPVTATATASVINTKQNIETNFQIAEANLTVSRENTLDTIEANRQNANNRIVADWHLQQDRNEFATQMETRR